MRQLKFIVMFLMQPIYNRLLSQSVFTNWQLRFSVTKRSKKPVVLETKVKILLWSCSFVKITFWTRNKYKSGHQNWLNIKVNQRICISVNFSFCGFLYLHLIIYLEK